MKPTPAQSILLHSMLSAAVAIMAGFGMSIAQFYFAHGQDLILTGSFAIGSFAATFAAIRTAVWHAAITSPALPQAEQDLGNQALQVATQAMQRVGDLTAHVTNNVMPLLHQHSAPQQPLTGPAVSRAVTTPAARPSQAIPFPPPQSTPVAHFGETGMMPVPPSA